MAATEPDYSELPELKWEQRSDWLNVKTGMEGIGPAAVGDGVADDTAALQAAFDRVREPGSAHSTVYLLPPAEGAPRQAHLPSPVRGSRDTAGLIDAG
jgi:hypothetical protein